MFALEGWVQIQLAGRDGDVETLWARSIGADQYELENTPWYADGVSWQDILEARPEAPGGFPKFVRVVRKSGYRTIRLILDPPADVAPESQAVLFRLLDLGCIYESANPRHISVYIPQSVDLMAVREFLISTEREWEHADPSYEELFPGGAPAA